MQHGGIEKELSLLIERAAAAAFAEHGLKLPAPSELKSDIEIPKDKAHGDLSTNIAMRLARFARRAPLELAGLLKTKLEHEIKSHHMGYAIDRVEIKPPGFINFFLSKDFI